MRVIVIGGGLAGLCAAHSIRASSGGRISVTLLESSSQRLGGWLWSESKDGFLFERGCRGLRPSGSGKSALRLVEELGLLPEALASAGDAKSRYVLHGHTLQELRSDLLGAMLSPLTRGAPSWVLRDIFSLTPGDNADESVANFVERHFGRHVSRVLLDAALGGIYAGDIDRLSARTVLAPLWRAAQDGVWGRGDRHSSVILGFLRNALTARAAAKNSVGTLNESKHVAELSSATSVSFKKGMNSLPLALERSLRGDAGVEIRQGVTASRVERVEGGGVSVHISCPAAMPAISGDAIVFALPSHALGPLLYASITPNTPYLKPSAAASSAIPFASVGVVSMAWNHDPAKPRCTPYPVLPLKGFGYLVPGESRNLEKAGLAWGGRAVTGVLGIPILGMTWDSHVFPGQAAAQISADHHSNIDTQGTKNPTESRVAVMMGGATCGVPVSSWTESRLAETALAAARLQARVGVASPPSTLSVSIASNAIPQYCVGHSERVSIVERGLERSFGVGRAWLIGNSWRGVGASDTIEGALNVGKKLTDSLLRR